MASVRGKTRSSGARYDGEGDVGARGFGGHRRPVLRRQPQLSQLRIVGNDVERLSRQQKRFGIVPVIREPLNLGRGDGARPTRARALTRAIARRREPRRATTNNAATRDRRTAGRAPAGVTCRRGFRGPDYRIESRDEIGDRRKPIGRGFRQASTHDVRQSAAVSPGVTSERSARLERQGRRPGSRACCRP